MVLLLSLTRAAPRSSVGETTLTVTWYMRVSASTSCSSVDTSPRST